MRAPSARCRALSGVFLSVPVGAWAIVSISDRPAGAASHLRELALMSAEAGRPHSARELRPAQPFNGTMPLAERSRTQETRCGCVGGPGLSSSQGVRFNPAGTAISGGFRGVTKFAIADLAAWTKTEIELWRVGAVACHWMTDWRRIRIVSAGEPCRIRPQVTLRSVGPRA